MRALFLIPLAVAGISLKAWAQPASVRGEDAIIAELLSYPVPAEDWREHLQKRKQAGWMAPPMPSFGAADAADTERLVAYWETAGASQRDKPDAQVRARLLAYCEENPGAFGDLSAWFVPTEDDALNRIQKLHDRLSGSTAEKDIQARTKVRHWLAIHAGMFRDKLEKEAERYFETPEDAERRAIFEAYLKNEPAAAKAMLVTHVEDAAPAARCAALLHLHAMRDAQAEQWREKLQMLVTSDAPAGIRASALKGLAEVDWPEKTGWVINLFKDASLGSVKVSEYREEEPLAQIVKSKPDFWVPKIIPWVGDPNRAVHDNAVRCLAQFHLQDKREDALRALLPWLSKPKWALNEEHGGRLRLLQSVGMVNLPESVPGLRWVLKNDTAFMRRTAASALAHYQVAEVAPVVRELAAQEPNLADCQQLLSALLEMKGAPLDEQVRGVEQLEAQLLTKEGREALEEEDKPFPPADKQRGLDPARRMPVAMGAVLCSGGMFQSEALAHALTERMVMLREASPLLANALEARVSLWNTPTSRKLLVDRLRAGRFEAPWLALLFRQDPPKSLAEIAVLSVPMGTKTDEVSPLPEAQLRALQSLPATTAAIVALLVKDEGRSGRILKEKDGNAQAMLLACARLKRTPLPPAVVGALLDSQHTLCARSALLYLEAVDTPEARALVLSRFKGEAKILGAVWAHTFEDSWDGQMGRAQERLRQRVLTAKRPVEIYAMLSDSEGGGVGHVWIEIEGDKAVLFDDQGHERYGTRPLTAAELAGVRAYVTQQRVDELPPLTLSVFDGVQYEYLRLTAEGGRRVFMNNPGFGSRNMPAALEEQGNAEEVTDSVYVCLVNLFEKLAQDKSKLSVGYRLADEIPGFRIVIPREQRRVREVMQQPDGTLLVNILAPGNDSSRWMVATADGTVLPDKAASGPRLRLSDDGMAQSFSVSSDLVTTPWRATVTGGGTAQTAIRNADRMSGLWLCRDGQEPELMVKGHFGSPTASLDGRWLVVVRGGDAAQKISHDVVRVNVATREIVPLKMPTEDYLSVDGRQPHSGKILVSRRTYASSKTPEIVEHHWVDPATGVLERVTGEFIPLRDETWRPLQPTEKPGVVWAAVPRPGNKGSRWFTSIGYYDLRSLKFTPVMEVPHLYFTSMAFWVDQKTRLVYLAEGQDLLSFPLPEAVK